MKPVTSLIGSEVLDEPGCPPALARATLRDLARSNTLFGGRSAVWFGVQQLLGAREATAPVTVLDIGAGGGDISTYLVERARSRSVALVPVALDRHRAAAVLCRERGHPSMVADCGGMPLRAGSIDIVVLSQVLHHFHLDAAVDLLQRTAPLARRGVIIADLRRAHVAALGIWLAGLALRFHPVTRRDGVTSVKRGFSQRGLSRLMLAAGMPGAVFRRPGYRLVGVWRNPDAHD